MKSSQSKACALQEKVQPDWPAIRGDYLAGTKSIAEICECHDISRSTLSKARNRFGWPQRYVRRPVKRADLIGRLFGVLERQIKNMENQIMSETSADKEVALLGNLSRTLEKLVELDARQSPPDKKGKKTSREMTALREKITTRISQLEKG